MPRTLSLTPQIVDAVCGGISRGLNCTEAFKAVGITASTRTRWLRRASGREGRSAPLLDQLRVRIEAATLEAIAPRMERYEREHQERRRAQQEAWMEKLRAEIRSSDRDIPPRTVLAAYRRRVIDVQRWAGDRAT